MANKKYVIMYAEQTTICPTVAADDNKKIKAYQKLGYKIIGRISCNEGFIPDYVVTGVIHKRKEQEK